MLRSLSATRFAPHGACSSLGAAGVSDLHLHLHMQPADVRASSCVQLDDDAKDVFDVVDDPKKHMIKFNN
eukprot:11173685-Lingulodinium_polyedra.AAC.1